MSERVLEELLDLIAFRVRYGLKLGDYPSLLRHTLEIYVLNNTHPSSGYFGKPEYKVLLDTFVYDEQEFVRESSTKQKQ